MVVFQQKDYQFSQGKQSYTLSFDTIQMFVSNGVVLIEEYSGREDFW